MPPTTIPSSLTKVQNYERFCEVVNVLAKKASAKDPEPITENPYHEVRQKFHHELYNNILKTGARTQHAVFGLDQQDLHQHMQENEHFMNIVIERLYQKNIQNIQKGDHPGYIKSYNQTYENRNDNQAFGYFQEAEQIMHIQNDLDRLAPKIMRYTEPKHKKEYMRSKILLIDWKLNHDAPQPVPQVLENPLSEFSVGPDKKDVEPMLERILQFLPPAPSL